MQLTVLAITLALMAIVSALFIAAIRSTGQTTTLKNANQKRSQLIWGLLAFGAVVTIASLWSWPHAVRASPDVVTVNATGFQWHWEIDKKTVPLGEPVVFNVHTKDVTHGLGVVDSTGQLLFQTQAMPGYVNKVEHTFEAGGIYKIICMEFCGIGHHTMNSKFEVTSE